MKKNQLLIQLNGEQVGILEQTLAGKMIFSYTSSATQAISIAMPIREEPYGESQTEAYFGGLLPESETVKKIIGMRYGVSHNNTFGLLKAIGHDCAGAISCHATDDTIDTRSSYPLSGRTITDDELYGYIKELPRKPLFMDVDGLRLSLAGIHDKAAICMIDGKIALAENCPTTHILKPTSPHFEGLAENEYFCLKIAKRIGLPVPNIELRRIKDITFLLTERYDRRIKNGAVERIHQEDFCQALSKLPSKKYQNEGGPGLKDCFELLMNTAQPAKNRNLLASAVIFNYLICNLDAHGKNFSLLHHTPSNIQLAPFYDIVCTRAYPDLSSKMAMKIGSKYEYDDLFPRHWEQLCHDINYRYIAIKELIYEQADLILNNAKLEKENLLSAGYKTKILDKIVTVIEKNINRTLARFRP
jgi:serine/threonine-protein kinase HipA